MGAQIEIITSQRSQATCRLCDKPISRGVERVAIENPHVSPHRVKLFFHCGCFFDAVKDADESRGRIAE